MQVKTFESHSMKDAIKAIKKELGNDAVILSSKNKNLPGSDQNIIEVTAASAVSTRSQGAVANSADFSAQNQMVAKRLESLERRLEQIAGQIPSKTFMHGIETNLGNLKVLMSDMLKSDRFDLGEDTPRELVEIYKQLAITGVDEGHISKMLQHLSGLPAPDKKTAQIDEDYYRTHAMRWMFRRIKIAPPIETADGSPVVQALVGMSSVGKTTLLCKLASHIKANKKLKVSIASIDNSKLGGNESLRIYCKLLDIEFHAFNNAGEFSSYCLGRKNADVILLDTPAPDNKDASTLSVLDSIKQENIMIDFHLVLSLSEKTENQDKAIALFSNIGIASIAFTKFDDAWTFGELINLPLKWNVPISFFSMGSQIPEDFELATRERIIAKIFGI